MKQFITGLMLAMVFCVSVQGNNWTIIEKDESGNTKRVIELRDTVIDGKETTDTLSVMTYENSSQEEEEYDNKGVGNRKNARSQWNDIALSKDTAGAIVAATAIIFIFGLPLLIVFIVFFFRYKNRKAQYRLAEQALTQGQPLPDNFFKKSESDDIRTKGIKNIFLGVGLFIFLWSITEQFGLGCIGLLIMFTGFGQLVIYYTQHPFQEQSSTRFEEKDNGEKRHAQADITEIHNPEDKEEKE